MRDMSLSCVGSASCAPVQSADARHLRSLCCVLVLPADSGIMFCMLGSSFTKTGERDLDRNRFDGDIASNSDSSSTGKDTAPGMM